MDLNVSWIWMCLWALKSAAAVGLRNPRNGWGISLHAAHLRREERYIQNEPKWSPLMESAEAMR
ncbi:hypothetical protein SV7mr_34790 [Stieleria bergensis]|uniref:Uncharacterized protein n=1 Tax=Stieleria bergensis TaxID=2528025 RepID=A0A517SXS3_9BACT|nr:hypothetical protein SV7mr_34790 [Planctomycetes bacterium SV_7m_r]